jgi:hypothetical protein
VPILDDLFMKNFKKSALVLFLLFPLFAQARITDGKDHLKLSKNKISVALDKGFHFVMQSPAGLYMDGELGSMEPLKKTENQMVFDVSHVEDKSFTVSYYVCDDQKTVCESHESHLKLVKGKMVTVVDPAANPKEK